MGVDTVGPEAPRVRLPLARGSGGPYNAATMITAARRSDKWLHGRSLPDSAARLRPCRGVRPPDSSAAPSHIVDAVYAPRRLRIPALGLIIIPISRTVRDGDGALGDQDRASARHHANGASGALLGGGLQQ